MAGTLAIFGVSIKTLNGKPSKVSAGKSTDSSGKFTVHVPATVGTVDDAISACESYKGSIKLTMTAKDGNATLANTVNLDGASAAAAIRQMREVGTGA